MGGVIDVTYVLDMPHGYEWKGEYCNANSRAVEVTPSHSPLTQGGRKRKAKGIHAAISPSGIYS